MYSFSATTVAGATGLFVQTQVGVPDFACRNNCTSIQLSNVIRMPLSCPYGAFCTGDYFLLPEFEHLNISMKSVDCISQHIPSILFVSTDITPCTNAILSLVGEISYLRCQ